MLIYDFDSKIYLKIFTYVIQINVYDEFATKHFKNNVQRNYIFEKIVKISNDTFACCEIKFDFVK